MKGNVPEQLKDFTLQDIMQLSRDLEILQEDIDMMNRFCNPDTVHTLKKKD